jgi:hypothetical protein
VDEFCEVRLVADDGAPPIDLEQWEAARFWILELQPARSARLEGDPPRAIRIEAYGDAPDVAPALLAHVERLTKTSLRVEACS